MKTKVLLFGPLTEVVGKNEIEISGCPDVESLKASVEGNYPGLKRFKYAIAVNKTVVNPSTILKEGDTVALLPPFAGG